MKHTLPFVAALLLALAVSVLAQEGEPLPLGHADFYPSATRPVGLLGDGSGHFPAAAPPTKWDFRTGENVVWMTKLPSYGYSSPIVVGDKVFVTAEFNRLICIDARTGKVLWERENWTFDEVGGDKADELRGIWQYLTSAHAKAWACCFEIAYLSWKLDVIAAAKAGRTFEWPSGSYGKKGFAAKTEDVMAANHLTPDEWKQVTEACAKLTDAEVTALKARLEELKELRAANRWEPNVSGYVSGFFPFERGAKAPPEWEAQKKRHMELVRVGITNDMWNGWLGTAFPTPTSDGEHVYVNFGQSQVVCYDLDGNRKWMRVLYDTERMGLRTAQNFCGSPLLIDDKVITLHGGTQSSGPTMWAIDKVTGELRWKRHMPHQNGSGHPFAQIQHMRHGDINLIIGGNGMVVDPADGRVVMEGLITLCAPPLVHENRAYYIAGLSQSGNGMRCAVQFDRVDGEVKGTMLWAAVPTGGKDDRFLGVMGKHMDVNKVLRIQAEKEGTEVGSLVINGRIVVGSKADLTIDPDTGVATQRPVGYAYPGAQMGAKSGFSGHLIRAGDYIYQTGKHTFVGVRSAAEPHKYVGMGVTGSKWQRELQLLELPVEEMTRVIHENAFMPNYDRWAMMQSTPFAQGGRLYVRVRDTLICVGDPTKPYHSPKDAPATAKTPEAVE